MARRPGDPLDRSHHGTALIRLGCKCGAVTFAVANEKWPPCATCGSDRWSRALEPRSPPKPAKPASRKAAGAAAKKLRRLSLTEDTRVTPNAAVAVGHADVGTTLAEGDDDTTTTAPRSSRSKSRR